MGSLDSDDAKFSQAVLLMLTSLSMKDQIARLRMSVRGQMEELQPPATFPAKLNEPIYEQ